MPQKKIQRTREALPEVIRLAERRLGSYRG